MLPDHLTTVDKELAERIAAAIRREFPALIGATGGPDIGELADVAALAVQGGAASRCIPFLRPHPWTRWRIIQLGSLSLMSTPQELQQRECARCGRVQRATLGAS